MRASAWWLQTAGYMAAAITPHDATDKELLTFLAPHYADALLPQPQARARPAASAHSVSRNPALPNNAHDLVPRQPIKLRYTGTGNCCGVGN